MLILVDVVDATSRLVGVAEGAEQIYASIHNYVHIDGMHTSCRCCFHGYCWRTVSCCIPGNDGNIIVTVLLHISQSMGPGITRHRLHDIATSKPTVIFHEGVSDEILVDHFSSWLCPGEADSGGVRGGATEVSRGGRENNCRAKVT